MRRIPWICSAALAVAACTPLRSLNVQDPGTYTYLACPPGESCPDAVQLTYLGTGGFVIRNGTHAIMTAPFFSHQPLWELFRRHASNDSLVREKLKPIDVSGINTILVGHSHYDHLMDVPSIMRSVLPNARLLGSPTMRFTMLGDHSISDVNRLVAIDTMRAGSQTRKGEWITINDASNTPRFRIKALVSTHAPNIKIIDFTIADDTLRNPLTELPAVPGAWPKGEVYAYVIDVLSADGARTIFRIFYQDSASDPEHSTFPYVTEDRRVDLAIVCAGNYDGTPAYPATLLGSLKPRFALVGHWENFFRGVDDDLQIIPLLNGYDLRNRMRDSLGANWATLRPFSVAKFPVANGK